MIGFVVVACVVVTTVVCIVVCGSVVMGESEVIGGSTVIGGSSVEGGSIVTEGSLVTASSVVCDEGVSEVPGVVVSSKSELVSGDKDEVSAGKSVCSDVSRGVVDAVSVYVSVTLSSSSDCSVAIDGRAHKVMIAHTIEMISSL